MEAVISLTTIPNRIGYLGLCVESLIKQGLPVYAWLPRYVERLGEGFDQVPDLLVKLGVQAEIVEDQGPATKLLPALARFEMVITADDDHIYGPGWAAGLLDWAARRPDAALGYRGRRFVNGLDYTGSVKVTNPKRPTRVQLITGVHGALYRRRHFGVEIFDEWEKWPPNDDIVVGAHLWRRGVSMLVIPRRCTILPTRARHVDRLTAENVEGALNDIGLRRMYAGWRKQLAG